MNQSFRKLRKFYRRSFSELSACTGLPMRYIIDIEEGNVSGSKEHRELLIDAIQKPWKWDDEGTLTAEDVIQAS